MFRKPAVFTLTAMIVVLTAGSAAAITEESLVRVRAGLEAPARFAIVNQPLHEAEEPAARRDSPWDGLLIGAVLGAAIGFSTYTPCEPQPPHVLCEGNLTTSRGMETAAAAALFGAIGLTVDLLIQKEPAKQSRGRSHRFQVAASPDRISARFVARY